LTISIKYFAQVDQGYRRGNQRIVVAHEHNAQECQFGGDRVKLCQYLETNIDKNLETNIDKNLDTNIDKNMRQM